MTRADFAGAGFRFGEARFSDAGFANRFRVSSACGLDIKR